MSLSKYYTFTNGKPFNEDEYDDNDDVKCGSVICRDKFFTWCYDLSTCWYKCHGKIPKAIPF